MNSFTFENLVSRAKQSKPEIWGTHIPSIGLHYTEFANRAGLDADTYPMLETYIRNASYTEKKDLFRNLGFDVLYLTLSANKVYHFMVDRNAEYTLDDAFLDNERNIFMLDITHGLDSLYIILEYSDPSDPLAEHTVDRGELAAERERQEKIRSIFGRNKK